MRRIISLYVALLLLPLTQWAVSASAQADPSLTQYFQAPTFFNPAAAGDTDYLRIRGGSRLQWVGIDNAPTDFIATGDVPFKLLNRRYGAGAALMQESIGLYNTLSVGAQLSGRQKLGKGVLSIGAQVNYLSQKFRGSEVFIPDDDDYHESSDEAIPTTDVTGSTVDLAAGVWYNHPRFWAGVSCTHLMSPTVKMKRESTTDTEQAENYEFQFDRTLYFMVGSNIPLKNTLFEVLPSLMVRTDLATVQADITARLRWKKFLTFGVGYRTQDAVSVLLEAELKGITLAYSYDYATSSIMRASSGSHEVWVGYSMKLDFNEQNRNRHKSIRIL
jgi:type IX secretion system PorP/SprF family membrane protein